MGAVSAAELIRGLLTIIIGCLVGVAAITLLAIASIFALAALARAMLSNLLGTRPRKPSLTG